MGFLKRLLKPKEEKIHYERDEEGKILQVARTSSNGFAPKPKHESDELIRQYKEKRRQTNPSIWDQYKQRRTEEKQVFQKAYQRQKTKSIETRAKRLAQERYNPKPQPIFTYTAPYGGHKTRVAPPSRTNANPFGSLFDTGLSSTPRQTKPRTTQKNTKYVIKGGKAYPLAGTTKKTKKKTSRSSNKGYDMMDNWGFFK